MKCMIIGGGNGLGLSISRNLSLQKNDVTIFDIKKPSIIDFDFEYKYIDLNGEDLSNVLSVVNDYDVIVYTAGIGKIKRFDDYTLEEISMYTNVNMTSLIKIITKSSKKLKAKKPFYFLCVSSIAGIVSSPLFSVYSATKAGVCKYVEAVNTELDKLNCNNRITNVIATAFNGTAFNGGTTDLSLLDDISRTVLDAMFNHEEICMINESLIFSIYQRYIKNPKKFSLESYDYKIKSGRINK